MTGRAGGRQQLRAAIARFPSADRRLRRLRRTAELEALQGDVSALRAELAHARASDRPAGATTVTVSSSVAPFLTEAPPGHFYSPVPDLAEISASAERLFSPAREVLGVDLHEDEQLALFETLAALAREVPFAETPGTDARYGLDNPNYGVGDASMLQAMLRHLRPRRYLEVGSGYTTALALDVRDRFLAGEMSVTAIEPYPELLAKVLRPGDDVEVIAAPVQSVPLERFAELGAGDVLFVDCSHVAKTGSDVAHIYTQVFPVLAEGVVVHVHDVFWPFEYLRHWVEAGRAWNEAYMVHAFLAYNSAFEILLWNHYLAIRHPEAVARALPVMLENPGGALWMRRRTS